MPTPLPSPSLHVVVPAAVTDPRRPSGGNVYDQRLCDALVQLGWTVRLHPVAGSWPTPTAADRRGVDVLLAGLPDRAHVLVDGLVGSTVPEQLERHRARLRQAVLVHLPLEHDHERRALGCVTAVVATSDWTRGRLLTSGLDPCRVHVAEPGVDPAPLAEGSRHGGRLLCVGPVTSAKGHDLLLDALSGLDEKSWSLTCVGALDRDPDFVAWFGNEVRRLRLTSRVTLTGPVEGSVLGKVYAVSDLLVLASRRESYGMVVTEALARGLPAVVTDVGGLSSTLGRLPDGRLPGAVVRGDDADDLRRALRRWLRDDEHRADTRAAAARRRCELRGWSATAARVAEALAAAA
jgi:glycosyltransferase involved in cell wall biosynthesis